MSPGVAANSQYRKDRRLFRGLVCRQSIVTVRAGSGCTPAAFRYEDKAEEDCVRTGHNAHFTAW